jgi:hypothetical protein
MTPWRRIPERNLLFVGKTHKKRGTHYYITCIPRFCFIRRISFSHYGNYPRDLSRESMLLKQKIAGDKKLKTARSAEAGSTRLSM